MMVDPTKTLATCVAAIYSPIGGPEDQARSVLAITELPALAKFARDVLALHRPDWSDWGHDHPEEQPNCTCGYNGAYEDCPTVQLATEYGIATA